MATSQSGETSPVAYDDLGEVNDGMPIHAQNKELEWCERRRV